jgi:hypothetical protein
VTSIIFFILALCMTSAPTTMILAVLIYLSIE